MRSCCLTEITCQSPTQSHYTGARPTSYGSWFILHAEWHASGTTTNFQVFGRTLVDPAPTGNRMHKTWSMLCHPLLSPFTISEGDTEGLFTTRDSIRSPHLEPAWGFLLKKEHPFVCRYIFSFLKGKLFLMT